MSLDIKTADAVKLIKEAARQLTGAKRREYEARITQELLDGSVRQAETVFGWSRQTVQLGLHELRTGIRCQERFRQRGRRRTEEQDPKLAEAIHRLAEPLSQEDPQFKSPLRYTRLTAAGLREALIEQAGYAPEKVPAVRTLSTMLNRLGYRLRPVQKSRPAKKIAQTDAIFANVHEVNQEADASPECLRISLDCKATVDLGDYSREGQARGPKPVAALDHDLAIKKSRAQRDSGSPER
jgi:transposase